LLLGLEVISMRHLVAHRTYQLPISDLW
jgi:hypothetical protein